GPLVLAARGLQAASMNDDDKSRSAAILTAAQALTDKKLAEQRDAFKPLGTAMLALASTYPPSATVAPKLFHMHCPMAKGDWLQASDTIANPFYADEMKDCAEIVREIPARAKTGGSPHP